MGESDRPRERGAAISPGAELEFIWRAFGNLNEWVRFSDSKAAAVLAADGVIVGAIATCLAGSHLSLSHQPAFLLWLAALLAATAFSAACALGSLKPKLNTSEESSSLVFFIDIARDFPSSKEFTEAVCEALADPDRAVVEIAQQVWCNSQVAKIKYERVARALVGLSWALYIGLAGVALLITTRLAEALSGR